MPPPTDPWNSLELAKLLVGVLTPLSVVGFGWFVSRRLKRLDLAHWSNQRLIEKRLELYDKVAPLLNRLLCFYTWVGNWKEISPEHVIKAKRYLDKKINIYRHLYEPEVYDKYQAFVHVLFETYAGAGHNARILSVMNGPDGDRTTHAAYKWNPAWTQWFSTNKVASKEEVRARYGDVMGSLRRSLGL